jgi:hypothetical protein
MPDRQPPHGDEPPHRYTLTPRPLILFALPYMALGLYRILSGNDLPATHGDIVAALGVGLLALGLSLQRIDGGAH